ncbi:MAG: hypothetical protein JNM28_08965 [Armatimonadetes bacterium]|nr:hypothetical protein [Armatimonadota bacterium]MBS1710808.1 hypothetical protein [Armatimonadota bacterium]MBX3108480.1 hypothetical protein [Fimbriimonadaceae bacterium]
MGDIREVNRTQRIETRILPASPDRRKERDSHPGHSGHQQTADAVELHETELDGDAENLNQTPPQTDDSYGLDISA